MRFPVVFALAMVAHAQPSEKARIEGSVVSVTGDPIAHATIRLTGPPSVQRGTPSTAAFAATSDDTGKFVIEDIDPGRGYRLAVQRAGFVTASHQAPLTFEAGASVAGIAIKMAPQGIVSGKITDGLGDPVQAASVRLFRRGYENGVRQLVSAGSANSNDQGEYRIANLSPGRYYVLASGSREVIAATPPGFSISMPTYYPNATSAQAAAFIDVGPGQEVHGIDIRLRDEKTFAIRGRILDVSGSPFSGVVIAAVPKGVSSEVLVPLARRNLTSTKADGVFEVRGLTPGLYTVTAAFLQPNTSRGLGYYEVSITNTDVSGLELRASPGSAVVGTIRLEEGDLKPLLPAANGIAGRQAGALAGAAENAGVTISGLRPLIRLTETPSLFPTLDPVQVNEDGTFLIENIGPSKFQLNMAALPSGVYVKSARFNGADALRGELDLTLGGGNLEIVLSNKAGNITGMVTPEKDESVAGLTISLWTNDEIRTTNTDQNGAFQFQNLRPGTYQVATWEEIDLGLAQAREFLNLVKDNAVKLEIAEGARFSVQLKIVSADKIKAAEEKLP